MILSKSRATFRVMIKDSCGESRVEADLQLCPKWIDCHRSGGAHAHWRLSRDFQDLAAASLGAVAAKAALARSAVRQRILNELIFGCVLAVQARARLPLVSSACRRPPEAVTCTTVNKMCGFRHEKPFLLRMTFMRGSARGRFLRRHGEHDQRALFAGRARSATAWTWETPYHSFYDQEPMRAFADGAFAETA